MNGEVNLILRSYRCEVEVHEHDFYQLVLPINGSLKLEVGREGGEVRQRTMALIPPGVDHCFESSGENQFVVAGISLAYTQRLDSLPAFLGMDEPLTSYSRFLQHALSETHAATDSFACQQMLQLLIQLLCKRPTEAPLIDKRVAAAKTFLEQRFDENITMQQLSRQVHISPRQLGELFRNSLGVTPQQYLLELRMNRAWDLLAHLDLSVQRISELVGYTHLSSFSDRFRRKYGLSPQQHRSKNKKIH